MKGLVLSLFPGIGLLDRAFEEEGFCVVRGPDFLWGGDVRSFHPPAGVFSLVIGGPPCQEFSSSNTLVRSRGNKSRFGNMVPEFERCVREASPLAFLMENVKKAPIPSVDGYGVYSFFLNNREAGGKQNRVRRWSFGSRAGKKLRVETVVFEHPERTPAATTSLWIDGRQTGCKSAKYVPIFAEWQGLPSTFDIPPFKTAEKVRAICNGVPLPMGRAIAKAVKAAMAEASAA